jgi:RNA polymerase sigma factor (sigma-70 family)
VTEQTCYNEFRPLIRSIANKLRRGSEDREDLVAVGRLAAWNALKSFELGRGTLLQTWIYQRAYSVMRHYSRDCLQAGIRLPAREQERNTPYIPVVEMDALRHIDSVLNIKSVDDPERETIDKITREEIFALLDARSKVIVKTVMDGGTVTDGVRKLGLNPCGSYRTFMARRVKRNLLGFYERRGVH